MMPDVQGRALDEALQCGPDFSDYKVLAKTHRSSTKPGLKMKLPTELDGPAISELDDLCRRAPMKGRALWNGRALWLSCFGVLVGVVQIGLLVIIDFGPWALPGNGFFGCRDRSPK